MRECLERYEKEAQVNVERVQKDHKCWYEEIAQQRELIPGQNSPDLTPDKQQQTVGEVAGFLCSAEEDRTSDI